MSCQQHGDHFIPDFLVAHGLAVFIACGNEHGHDVGSPFVCQLLAAPDLVVQQPVDIALEAGQAPPGSQRQERVSANQESEIFDYQRAQTRCVCIPVHAENGAQNNVQSDFQHA